MNAYISTGPYSLAAAVYAVLECAVFALCAQSAFMGWHAGLYIFIQSFECT